MQTGQLNHTNIVMIYATRQLVLLVACQYCTLYSIILAINSKQMRAKGKAKNVLIMLVNFKEL
jgi:hypothetical protein